LSGAFQSTDWNIENEMMQVNIVAATHLTKLFLPQIRAREGKIMNVASTAAFQPGPFMSVYYASKAYLLSFSEALAEELEGSGVTVTCLCPGPVKTNFQRRAYLEGTAMLNSPLLVDVREVALVGYEGMMRGKRLVIPGWKNRAGVELLRLSPRAVVTKVVRRLQEKKNG
jgi:short-subunit dehydrogenase